MVNAKHIPALLLLLAATLASCVYDNEPALHSDDGRQAVQVTFTLAAGNAPTDTRAEGPTWGDVYPNENGTEWEKAIDPDDLQVLLYTAADNGYVARVENLVYFRNDDGTYTYHGQLTADADDLTPDTEYKIMVFANCGINNDTETNIYTLANTTFTRDGADYIPLWGVKTTTLNLTPGTANNLDKIDLLRAMAKVEVTLSDALTGEYTLNSVTLNRYNTTGYCLPAGYNAVRETKDLEREDDTPASFRPYPSLETTPLSFTVSDDGNTAVYYLPEYAKSDANPAQLTITLAKDGNKTKDYTLHLKDYNTDNGGYYDLVRNHIYRYIITGVNDGALTVQYLVLPWELVSTETGWPGNSSGYKLRAEGGNDEDFSGDDAGDADVIYGIICSPRYDGGVPTNDKLENSTGGARFEFIFTKPEGVVWTAHLSNTEDFYFSTNTTGGKHMVSNGISSETRGENNPYIIQINARHRWTEWQGEDDFNAPLTKYGQSWETEQTVPSTYFYITASLDGEHEVELNINPTSDNATSLYKEGRRFPGTGTRIWIRQLRAVEGWGFEQLAQNVAPTSPDFQWWRVNPYWK